MYEVAGQDNSPKPVVLLRRLRNRMKGSRGAGGTARDLETALQSAPGRGSSKLMNRLGRCMPSRSTYLEIGVARGKTFVSVDLPFKWGVDPHPRLDLNLLPPGCRFSSCGSDEFFDNLDPGIRFDLIYLDGLHHWHQTYRDLLNCFDHAHPHTVIVVDDVVPCDEYSARTDRAAALAARHATGDTSRAWHGDVYKVMFALRDYHPQLEFRVIADGANPQAVIWSPAGFAREDRRAVADADSYSEQTYSTVFTDGLPPAWFRCVTEDEAVRALSAASRSPR